MAGLPPGAPMMRFPQQPLMQPPVPMPPLAMVTPRPPLMPMPPPVMMHPTMGMPPMPVLPRPTIQIQAPPTITPEINKAKFKPVSVGEMQVATTVFVGNITDKATDTLVRQVLLRCGYIVGWKRVQDATGKLQAFGFCEYADPECALRAMRLLNGFTLGAKDLVVKVDSKNRKELLKYIVKKKKMKANQTVDDEEVDKEAQEIEEKCGADGLKQELTEDTKAEDATVLQSIQTLVRDNIDILTSSKSTEESRRERDVEQSILAMAKQAGKIDEDTTLDDMDMDKEMMALVSDEITKFRQSYQNFEKEKAERRAKKDKERRERIERDRSREGRDKPSSEKKDEKERSRERSRSPRIERERPRSPRSRSQERRDREKEAERRRERERERMAREEEDYEQKQMEWKKHEREQAYKDRLKQWERRESRKAREFDSLKEDDEHRKRKREKERKKLARFFEEYDDEEEDPAFYSGSELLERRRRREAEMDEDERDRRREKEERDALHLQVIERRLREREEEERKRMEEAERRANLQEDNDEEDEEEEARVQDEDDDEDCIPVRTEIDENIPLTKPGYEPIPVTTFPPIKVQAAPSVHSPANKPAFDGVKEKPFANANSSQVSKVAFGISKRAAATKSSLDGVFGGEDETDNFKPKMKKGLSLIHSAEGAQLAAAISEVPPGTKISPEERKKLVQKLVNSIPTKRDDIFSWDLKWNMVDHTLMEKRIAPWINKKIVEYIGETDPDITDFLCNKLAEHVTADDLLRDFAVVMEDDAEVFILKLWRLLIYETEAKHLGIAKSY